MSREPSDPILEFSDIIAGISFFGVSHAQLRQSPRVGRTQLQVHKRLQGLMPPIKSDACAQPPQNPAQRAKLQGKIANAQRHTGHSREASTAFSEACTAFLRIVSRIGANAFEHFRRAALRSAPSSSSMPARDISLRHCISARRTLQVPPQCLSRCFAVTSRFESLLPTDAVEKGFARRAER